MSCWEFGDSNNLEFELGRPGPAAEGKAAPSLHCPTQKEDQNFSGLQAGQKQGQKQGLKLLLKALVRDLGRPEFSFAKSTE